MSAVSEQVVTLSSIALGSQNECPICMETIEGLCNRVVTECGHAFHCSCLMQNTAHNGFGCPYCRTKMAEEPEEPEEEDEELDFGYSDDESEVTIFDSDALTSFRMFHQRINGEEVEEEEAEEWESVVDEEEEAGQLPDAAYIAEKLAARGITFEDLVKDALYQEHSNYGHRYNEYERRSSEVYGQFRAIMAQYTPPVVASAQDVPVPVVPAPTVISEPAPALPIIAESKSAVRIGVSRRAAEVAENFLVNI